jgi:excisionase family DNA binding protein
VNRPKTKTTRQRRQSLPVPTYDSLPELVTPEEAAAFLRVSIHGAYNLIRSGDLPSIRFGRLIRIRRSALLGDSETRNAAG